MPESLPNRDPSHSSARRGDLALALGAALATFAAYASTAAPGVVAEGDCAEYVAAARVGGIPHAPGYPTYVLLATALARVVPAEGLARALNLASALCGALAVGLVALLAARLARRAFPEAGALVARGAGAVAAGLLALSTEFWNQSLLAEVYSLAALLLAACLLWLLASDSPRRLSLAALAAGLAFGAHYTVAAPAALLVALAAWRERGALGARGLARVALALALGLATFLYLPLRSLADPALDFGDPETPGRLWRMLTLADMPTGKSFAREPEVLFQQLGALAGLARGQWPAWAFALPALGVLAFARRAAPLGAGLALAAVIALDYAGILAVSNFAPLVPMEVYEQRFLFLPAYLALAVLGGLGFAQLAGPVARRAALAPAALLALLALGLAPWLFSQRRLLDRGGDTVMREYGRGLLAAAEGPALVLTFGDNAWMAMTHAQLVEGERPDVVRVAAGLLQHEWYRRELARAGVALPDGAATPAGIAAANAGRVALYHADPAPRALAGFQEVPSGLLTRLVPNGGPVEPSVPPAPELSGGHAPLDLRAASLRAETANAYLRTAQWCRRNGYTAEAEQAAEQGLSIPVPEPRIEDSHVVRAALLLELGDLQLARGQMEGAQASWRAALEEGVETPHVELARKRLAAFGE